MGKPKPPDPAKTAAAQGEWNSFTAQQQQAMNMIGQNSPWGSLSYEQTGTQTIIGPNGKPYQIPMYTANTSLTPEQQAIFDQSQQAQTNLAGLAADQSASLRDRLNNPFEFTNSDAEQWAYDLASPRILEHQAQNEAQLRTTLANKGIREGSAAWDAEMARLTNANTDQLNQLALTGRQQAYNEARDQYTLPINSIGALLSGSQVQNPNSTFANAPQTQVGGVDYTGLVNQNYQQRLQASQGLWGGLGGLFSAGVGLFSDRRLKTDIKRIGQTDGGTPIYTYKYVWGGPTHMGVMAQDVPDAAFEHESGYLMVNYAEVE